MANLRLIALVFVAVIFAGCVHLEPLPYAPQPERVSDPIGETKSIITANPWRGCIAVPDVADSSLVVRLLCTGGVANLIVRLDRIKEINLASAGEVFRVQVVHTDNTHDFFWKTNSKESAQRLADAIMALSKPKEPAPREETVGI
jgi:hypothetical protein